MALIALVLVFPPIFWIFVLLSFYCLFLHSIRGTGAHRFLTGPDRPALMKTFLWFYGLVMGVGLVLMVIHTINQNF
jgi:hypothetical protein